MIYAYVPSLRIVTLVYPSSSAFSSFMIWPEPNIIGRVMYDAAALMSMVWILMMCKARQSSKTLAVISTRPEATKSLRLMNPNAFEGSLTPGSLASHVPFPEE